MQYVGGTNVCLILVNLCKETECILQELGYWFNFISYQSMDHNKCKAVVVGSHADLVTDAEASRKLQFVSDFTQQYLSHTPRSTLEILSESLTLNCRQPRSSRRVNSLLLQLVTSSTHYYLSGEAALLLGLLERDFKNVVTCKPQILLAHILETGIFLPNKIEYLYPILRQLDDCGLLMIIRKNSSRIEDGLLLLDVPKLTNEVHELLFSDASTQKFLSSTNPQSASMGILPKAYLENLLPEYITTDCLIQLQYCQELSHSEVKFDHSVVPKDDSSAPTLLYFPALCKTERKKTIATPDSFNYNISWYLECVGKFDYLPPRFLHVLLLRLAYSFALPAAHDQTKMECDDVPTVQMYNHRCTMWKNGIHWLMEEGVECFVENVNNSKGMVVIARSEETLKSASTNMLLKIIKEINQAKEEFCRTVTLQQHLMDSDDPTSFTNKDKLFFLSDVARVLREEKPLVISTSGQGYLNAAKITHLTKYIHLGKHTILDSHFICMNLMTILVTILCLYLNSFIL